MKINWKWPYDERKGIVPWYVILRRCPGWPIIMIGVTIAYIGTLMSYGLKEADDMWNRII